MTKAVHISTRYLFTALILIATAIPSNFRAPYGMLRLPHLLSIDVVANVALYIPFGMAFAEGGFLSVLWRSAVLSAVIEFAQLSFVGRVSQPTDVLANVAGAMIGVTLAFLPFRFDRLRLTRPLSAMSFIGAATWVVLCPAVSRDYRWLINPSGSLIQLLQSHGPEIKKIREMCRLLDAGPPANSAFLALLIMIGLTGLLSRKTLMQNALWICIGGTAACLLLAPRNPGFYPFSFLSALVTSTSFMSAVLWRELKTPGFSISEPAVHRPYP